MPNFIKEIFGWLVCTFVVAVILYGVIDVYQDYKKEKYNNERFAQIDAELFPPPEVTQVPPVPPPTPPQKSETIFVRHSNGIVKDSVVVFPERECKSSIAFFAAVGGLPSGYAVRVANNKSIHGCFIIQNNIVLFESDYFSEKYYESDFSESTVSKQGAEWVVEEIAEREEKAREEHQEFLKMRKQQDEYNAKQEKQRLEDRAEREAYEVERWAEIEANAEKRKLKENQERMEREKKLAEMGESL